MEGDATMGINDLEGKIKSSVSCMLGLNSINNPSSCIK